MNEQLTQLTNPVLAELEEKGFIGPFPLFEKREMDTILTNCSRYPRMMLPWEKGRHMVVREMAQVAARPAVLEKIVSLLGPNVLLWGSQIIRQPASGKHRWHVDIENTSWPGVTVWLAARNVISKESIGVITGSHRFKVTPQELSVQQGLDLKDDAAVEKAAQLLDPQSRMVYVPIEDGQFIIFHGKLWHGTRNTSSRPRYSMIFQYTTPDSKVRIPKNNDYPNTSWYPHHPPCLLVHGQDVHGANKTLEVSAVKTLPGYLAGISYHLPKNLVEKIQRIIK